MIAFLSRLFIKNYKEYNDPDVRSAYGALCGFVGIVLNLFLFGFKYFAGIITASIAITADAFNNLSDAASSIITLLGFRLSRQDPDPDHPYGHGRLEYISGFIVSLLILLVAYELGKSSILKILSPEPSQFSPVTLIILVAAILVKGYMALYNKSVGKKISSPAMFATAADSFSDMISTTAVLICTLLSHLFHWNIDGWVGLLVAIFILFNGIKAVKETVDPLLGTMPDQAEVNAIADTVLADPMVCGVHDLMIHDYGPGRKFISLHAEVPNTCDIMQAHDAVDNLETLLFSKFHAITVIHMDPVNASDERTLALREQVRGLAKTLASDINIHDFRIVSGDTHTNLIFDMVVPFRFQLSDPEVISRMKELISTGIGPEYFAVITVDHPYSNEK